MVCPFKLGSSSDEKKKKDLMFFNCTYTLSLSPLGHFSNEEASLGQDRS